MSKVDDGGAAFPCEGDYGAIQYGMTLRDWFAGQVIAGFAARDSYAPGIANPGQRASLAYIDADAMLAERKKQAPAQ